MLCAGSNTLPPLPMTVRAPRRASRFVAAGWTSPSHIIGRWASGISAAGSISSAFCSFLLLASASCIYVLGRRNPLITDCSFGNDSNPNMELKIVYMQVRIQIDTSVWTLTNACNNLNKACIIIPTFAMIPQRRSAKPFCAGTSSLQLPVTQSAAREKSKWLKPHLSLLLWRHLPFLALAKMARNNQDPSNKQGTPQARCRPWLPRLTEHHSEKLQNSTWLKILRTMIPFYFSPFNYAQVMIFVDMYARSWMIFHQHAVDCTCYSDAAGKGHSRDRRALQMHEYRESECITAKTITPLILSSVRMIRLFRAAVKPLCRLSVPFSISGWPFHTQRFTMSLLWHYQKHRFLPCLSVSSPLVQAHLKRFKVIYSTKTSIEVLQRSWETS